MAARRSARCLSLVLSALLLARALADGGGGGGGGGGGRVFVRVELQMARWAARGGGVRLRCVHDVPPHALHKVVFLRHGTTIFQYIRDRKPPYRNYTTPGAVLNVALATDDSIVLQNLELAASGSYSCEVSMDTPIYTKASAEKQLTVFHPQRHDPRIEFPRRTLRAGETVRARCTSAPAFPAPHATWLLNGTKMEELAAHSHKYRVSASERDGRRGLRALERERASTPSGPGCALHDLQVGEMKQGEGHGEWDREVIRATSSRHRSRDPGKRELFVTVSELQLVATARLEVTCLTTIPEFRSIEDKFADIRNDTVILDVIRAPPAARPPADLPRSDPDTSGAGAVLPSLLLLCLLYFAS